VECPRKTAVCSSNNFVVLRMNDPVPVCTYQKYAKVRKSTLFHFLTNFELFDARNTIQMGTTVLPNTEDGEDNRVT
jgi:hypothetical protein